MDVLLGNDKSQNNYFTNRFWSFSECKTQRLIWTLKTLNLHDLGTVNIPKYIFKTVHLNNGTADTQMFNQASQLNIQSFPMLISFVYLRLI